MSAGLVLAVAISLAGSEWGLPGGEQTVRFDRQQVSGFSGCNRFSGSYSLKDTALAIGPLASTRMACAPDKTAAEQKWLDMLGQTRSVEATHLVLILKDGSGSVLAVLQRRDFD